MTKSKQEKDLTGVMLAPGNQCANGGNTLNATLMSNKMLHRVSVAGASMVIAQESGP
jgi:uncharacterized FlgJ-related protein